jgi:hypothetical protein
MIGTQLLPSRLDKDEPRPNVHEVNPNLAVLAKLLDDAIRIPGTRFRIGLDGLIGLIPIVGDLLTLVIARMFLKEADRLGVSRWAKARMVGNYLIDLLVGAIPLVGDAFDFAFRAHRRNLRILQAHVGSHPDNGRWAKRYAMNWPSAFLAALAAGMSITLYMLYVPRWLGMEQMDIGLTIAGMVAPAGGAWAFPSRFAWHLGIGSIAVLLYAVLLRYWQKQSTWATGAGFGVFLWLAGPMSLIPILLNGGPELSHPGIFMLDLGLGWTPAMIDLGAHLVHGMVAGVVYKHRRVFPQD